MKSPPHRSEAGFGNIRKLAGKLRRLTVVGWMASLLAAGGPISPLTAGEIPKRLLDAKGWRGSIVASVNGLENDDTYARHNAVLVCEVLVDEFDDSEPGLPTWRGKVVSSNLESSYQSVVDATTLLRRETAFRTAGPLEFKTGSQVKLVFHGERGWTFELATAQRKSVVSMVMPKTKPRIRQEETADISAMTKPSTVIPFPANRMVLFGSGEVKGVPISYSALQMQGGHIDEMWEWTAYFEPTSVEELKLEIAEPANYATWRPETTIDRGKGPPLEVTATLVSSKGGKPNTRVEKFIWELKGTSREPGVALNFPLDQIIDDPDLELDASGEPFVISQEKQRMERTVREGFTDNVKVVPFDWGAWSTLQVTAVLADGRRVVGKLKGKGEQGLRVPKRDLNSHIADGWKAKNKSGADELDDENEPVGDGNKGDGFALYEEYRGFVIEGKHIEGDPKAKDFFVLNQLAGGDGEAGIALFESLSGFRVHTTTLNTEISEVHRSMNLNFANGARVVDQHAVRLQTFASVGELGGTGAFTVSLDGSRGGKNSFRPGTTKGIGLLPRGQGDSDFSKPFNLSVQDAASAYDRAIAHELLHSVGAIHHGPDDPMIEFIFVPPKSPVNRVGRSYFTAGGGAPTELLDEAKHDVAAAVYVRYATALAQFMNTFRTPLMGNPGDPGYPKMSESDFESWASSNVKSAFDLKGLVGLEGGAHAGNQDCIMRYYFANFYPMTKPAAGYYVIAAGTEKIGSILCRSPDGTGLNAPGHSPQARHGNAAAGAGDCAAQISPSDLVPARPTPF